MSFYFNIETKEFPKHVGDLKLISPNWDESTPLEPWVLVKEVPAPNFENDETIFWKEPEYDGKYWNMVWGVKKLNLEELSKMEELAKKTTEGLQ
jgi:hypothetical protein